MLTPPCGPCHWAYVSLGRVQPQARLTGDTGCWKNKLMSSCREQAGVRPGGGLPGRRPGQCPDTQVAQAASPTPRRGLQAGHGPAQAHRAGPGHPWHVCVCACEAGVSAGVRGWPVSVWVCVHLTLVPQETSVGLGLPPQAGHAPACPRSSPVPGTATTSTVLDTGRRGGAGAHRPHITPRTDGTQRGAASSGPFQAGPQAL